MKTFLLFVIGVLAVLSIVAMALIPDPAPGDRTPLVWVTDPNPQRDPQVDSFNSLNPDCALRVDPDNSGVMKTIVQCSAGMGPDLIGHCHDSSIATYRDAGILLDVTDQAKTMGFGPDTLPEAARDLIMLRDPETLELRQYTYPANIYNTIIIYNKDLFDARGMSYPSHDLTWDEYIEMAKGLAEYVGDEKRVPAVFGGAGAALQYVLWSYEADYLTPQGTRCLLGTDAALDAAVFYHDLFFKHEVEPTPTQRAGVSSQGGWGGGSYWSWFGEGKIAMFFGSRWMLIQLRRHFKEQMEDGRTPPRMGACPVPRLRDGKRYSHCGARGIGINAMSPNRDKALKFLQFLAGETYCLLINEGADAMPGNRNFISIEQFRHPDWPDEEEVHQATIDSLPFARTVVRSLFIENASVDRAARQVQDTLIANPDLTREDIAAVLRRASTKVDEEIARNINHNAHLRRAYDKMVAQGAPRAAVLKGE